jgi:Ca2+:H+ antiporter
MNKLWYFLLLAAPLAVVLRLADAGPAWTFLAAGLGIVPLAALMGRATEALASRLGPHLGGLLNATFGNAAELILALVALSRGLHSVVKASLTGSIIGNALLVLGLSLLVGGLRHRRQAFDPVQAGLQANLLVLAAIGIAVPSLLHHALGRESTVRLSVEVAVVLLLTYLLSVLFSLLAPGDAEELVGPPAHPEPPAWGPWPAAGILLGATAVVALLSELLVGAIEGAQEEGLLEAWGMSEVFVGVILVAVIGNAAEHSTAVVMAWRNKVDLSLHVAVGSSLQVALLVVPVLVLCGLFVGPAPLDLHFTLLEVLALGASVIVVALVAADGRSHWMEGVLLLAVYVILALAFYHVPGSSAGP